MMRRLRIVLLIALVSVLGNTVYAGEISNEELLKLVQAQAAQIEQMKQELAALKKDSSLTTLRTPGSVQTVQAQVPDSTELRKMVKEEVAHAHREEAKGVLEDFLPASLRKLEIHGFVSQGYMWSDHNNYLTMNTEDGTAEWQDAALNVQSQVTDKLRLGLQLYTRNIGDLGDHELELDWAFADYRWKDWLGVRVGKIKTPIGFYNETQDLEFLQTWILLPQGMYNLAVRGSKISHMGLDLYGDISLKKWGELNYKVFGGSVDLDEDGGYSRMIASNNFQVERFDEKFAAGLDLKWATPLKGLTLGWSYLVTDVDLDGYETYTGMNAPVTMGFQNNIHFNTLSLQYAWKDLLFTAEYQRMYWEYESDPTFISQMVGPDDEMRTWYVALSYRFTDWFELGTYYSRLYGSYLQNRNDKQGQLNDFCLTARFDINPHWNVKIEGHHMDGAGNTGGVFDTENPSGKETDWNIFAIKTSFNF